MFTAKESQKITYLDQMALLQNDRNYNVSFFPPSKLIANGTATFLGQSASNDLPGSNTSQENAAYLSSKLMPQIGNILYRTENPLVHSKPTDDDTLCAPQKRFLIFDQTGNQTKFFFTPSFSPQNQSTPASAKGPFDEMAAGVNTEYLANPIFEEKWDENHLTDGEGENDVPEDTDEIDALFYSDSDDDEYDDNDDDEVASTDHTPFTTEEGYNNKDKLLEEQTEHAVDSNGPQKRQKLLDGTLNKSPAIYGNPYVDDEIDSVKREKKVKIRQAMGILESIIPGIDGRDPLSVIDNAIAYLKSMKTEAEALGLSYSRDESLIFP
ncbi:Transcription factor bHLH143 [Striga hermonthica]|uniref:Transcription factor bHLH143 n=1 Tax=Striga hermonthica TaxID=68872 RepID=A0A9N7RN87_STRHE|nr:Transcription factor bHLH143 [Striga hermonthica]